MDGCGAGARRAAAGQGTRESPTRRFARLLGYGFPAHSSIERIAYGTRDAAGLTWLNAGSNNLWGPLPPSWSRLRDLQTLSLAYNRCGWGGWWRVVEEAWRWRPAGGGLGLEVCGSTCEGWRLEDGGSRVEAYLAMGWLPGAEG